MSPPKRPSYKQRPRGVSVTVYDIQGNPISARVIEQIVNLATVTVKSSGVPSLAISVSEG